MYNSQMKTKKIIVQKCKMEKTTYDLPNPKEEKKKINEALDKYFKKG